MDEAKEQAGGSDHSSTTPERKERDGEKNAQGQQYEAVADAAAQNDITPDRTADLHSVRNALQIEDNGQVENEQVITIEERYARLKSRVEAKGNPDEEIRIGDIEADGEEYTRLVAAGISEEKIRAGRVTRQELLDAGFVFLNDLGGFEKRFIHATIDGIDFSKRTLLTAEELQKVREYQQQHADTLGFGNEDPDEVCEDMLRFLLAAKDPRTGNVYNPLNVLHEAFSNIERKGKQDMKSRITAAMVQARLENLYKAAGVNPNSKDLKIGEQMAAVKEQFIYDTMADIYPWRRRQGYPEYRGIKFEDIEIREKALRGKPSPFLESGFHFTDASDLRIETEHSGVVRLNMGNIVMAMGGLSEMGASSNNSYDQHYITTGEYIQDVFPHTPEERASVREDANRRYAASKNFDEQKLYDQMEQRVEALAEEWVASGDAPLHIKMMARSRGLFV